MVSVTERVTVKILVPAMDAVTVLVTVTGSFWVIVILRLVTKILALSGIRFMVILGHCIR